MRRPNLRSLPRVSYSELEEPSLDEYVFCEKCADFVFEYCSIHGPLLVVPDDKVPEKSPFPPCVPRAALTIPHVFLHIAPSIIPGAGLGIFSTLTLPRGVRFGPYIGTKSQKVNSMYCWQIRDQNNKPSHLVDASDAGASNWMRYVNCSRHWDEQNLIAYQYQGQIYYRTIKIIPRFTELLVFYGGEFAAALDVDLRAYNSPAGYAQKYGVPITKIPHQNPKRDSEKQQKEYRILEPLPKENHEFSAKLIDKKSVLYNDSTCTVPEIGLPKSQDEIRKNVAENNSELMERSSSRSPCSKAFSEKGNLPDHIRTHTEEKPYRCSHCSKAFSLKLNLTRHIKAHTGEKAYRCSHCSKAFSQKGHLITHLRTHTGEKPYRCSHCSKAFSKKGDLITHLRTHTGEKPYRCSHCSKAFSLKPNLTRHIRTHTGEKPYRCSHCSKAFSQKGDLITHLRTHTGEKPYRCSHCSKAFSRKNTLTDHIRTHTGEKPYRCSHCSKAFSRKNTLTDHIRTHTGEKPYRCSHCSKAFSQKPELINHLRTHIGKKKF